MTALPTPIEHGADGVGLDIDAERDRHAATLLALPVVRASILLPSTAAVVYGLFFGRIADMRTFLAAVAVALLLGGVAAARPWPTDPGREELGRRMERAWQVLCGVVGVALFAPVLVVALDVEVALFAPVLAGVMVTVLFSLPWRWRLPIASWTIIVWLITLLWSGVRDVPTLFLQLGGAILLLIATDRLATVLSDNLLAAQARRSSAERRARLLASVLRTNSLDPDDVLRAIVDGLMEAGFDVATIRTVDLERRTAHLIEGAATVDVDLPREVSFAGTAYPEVLATGRPVWVDGPSDPRIIPSLAPMRGLVLLPLIDQGSVTAVITAGMRERPVGEEAAEAAELLAEHAGAALVRARAFRADLRTTDELKRLDERTQDFISTVSHELRTPLTVVQGLGQTLVSRWDDLDAERRDDLLSRMDANAARLAEMVRSLLDTSAMESGDLVVDARPVDLREAVRGLLHRAVGITSVHPIEVDIPEGLQVEVDPGLFEHVVENLLTNVSKHTPSGTRARISGVRRGDRVHISVADAGPGIAPDDLPHVLDRFYRGGDPNRRASSGLGLGLALAREVVRAHDGRLEVASEVGRGTQFSFDVPAVGPADR